MKNKKTKRSGLFIFVFIIGIIAMALLLFVSVVQKFSPIILGAEAVVMLCLIFLLSSTLSSRKRIIEQDRERSKSPYGSVDQREIDKIFELIDKEEKRRGRSLAFLAGSETKMTANTASPTAETKTEANSTPAESTSSAAPADEEEDEDKLPIIFPDQDEYEGDSKPFSPISEERAAARKLEKENKEKEAENAQAEGNTDSSADEIADLVAAASMGAAVNELSQDTADDAALPDERKKGKRGKGGKNMDNRSKKRQPIYYDQYGNPIPAPVRSAPAQPVGYDQYGRPIYAQRPPQRKPHPIGFDQNGRPIYPPPQRKPRTPIGYDQYGRPIYAPAARQRPAGTRPQQGQRRRPAPGAAPAAEQAAAPVQQIPTEPMAASAADALAALEATQAAGGNQYYDEDYIPVVVHMEEDFEYADDRYTPRVRADFSETASVAPAAVGTAAGMAAAAVTSVADEYNSSGSNTYRPDYASEDIPVVVPVFEDMEVDYTASRGFTPMNDPYAQKGYAPPVYNPEPVRKEAPLAPTSIYQDPTQANPEYNAKSAADYTRDDDDDHFVFVPHFDDDDPIPEKPAEPEGPVIPHWKLAKMRRRKVTRRSRRGMLFKLKDSKFSEYMQALNSK